MLLKDNSDIDNANEGDSNNIIPLLEDDEEDVEYLVQWDALIIRKILNIQVKEEESNLRENIFYTCYLANGQICKLIKDGGSCINVASITLVDKLELTYTKHPNPYNYSG